ncbi:MAG: phosphate signaling complex protein PhoU [Acetobacterales bacterium]
MPADHIVKSYDEELTKLNRTIVEMGGLAESQLARALQSITRRDNDLAGRVVENDVRMDEMDRGVQHLTVRLFALRQPMAKDLRTIVGALRIASDMERIGDYAKNIGKRALALNQAPPVRPVSAIPRMGRLIQEMIKDIVDAYVDQDADQALAVWYRDEEVDDMHDSLFRELLTYMMEDPRNITSCTQLLFIAKNLERMGDHATNIAENIFFQVRGEPLDDRRPKGGATLDGDVVGNTSRNPDGGTGA